MNKIGFFRACAIIAAKDLRIEWRTLETSSSTITFSLAVLLIFNFTFGLGTVRQLGVERLVPGVLWYLYARGKGTWPLAFYQYNL